MAYKVSLTLVDGERIQRQDIYYVPTPKAGQTIMVNLGNRSKRAEVTRVLPGAVDNVDAQEV
jgi:hypothetical protein